jgi:hypothetical protein
MAQYATNNLLGGTQQAISSSYKTLLSVYATSGALRRLAVYDVTFATNGTPADNYMQYDISRMTADGTGTGVTPNPLDPADTASSATSKANYSAEPTVTSASSLLGTGLNQRASYRWVAAPGSELVVPATATNGLVFRALSGAYTGFATATALFSE